ncbi:MAG: recombinase XerD, partial [Phycisphaerae bacterium]|nr:recombinase XerD [Phycisphaerae bacterium]
MKATAPRKSARIPKLRHHKPTGQGCVRLNGRFIYLGRYDAPETRQKYHQLIAEWLANGRQLPQPAEEITVAELVARYWTFAEAYYVDSQGRPMPEAGHMRTVLRMLREA